MLRRGHSSNYAELLQHAQCVPDVPALRNLTAGNAMDPYAGRGHRLPGRRNSRKLAGLRATTGPARDHGVVRRVHRIDGPMRVGIAAVIDGDELLHPRGTCADP